MIKLIILTIMVLVLTGCGGGEKSGGVAVIAEAPTSAGTSVDMTRAKDILYGRVSATYRGYLSGKFETGPATGADLTLQGHSLGGTMSIGGVTYNVTEVDHYLKFTSDTAWTRSYYSQSSREMFLSAGVFNQQPVIDLLKLYRAADIPDTVKVGESGVFASAGAGQITWELDAGTSGNSRLSLLTDIPSAHFKETDTYLLDKNGNITGMSITSTISGLTYTIAGNIQ